MNQYSGTGANYKEQQILNASPAERVVLLYNGAVKFLMQARAAIDAGDIQERYNNNKRALEIIMYLQSTLDMEKGGAIAANLYQIYSYMQSKLIDVDMNNDQSAIDDVVGKLKELNSSWMKIAQGKTTENQGDLANDEGKAPQSVTSFDSSA